MRNFRITILLGIFMLFVTAPAWAAWRYADSYVYFDTSGHVVGESILTCSTATPRKASGAVTSYWRQDTIDCDTQTISGYQCTFYNDIQNGHVYPVGTWICQPNIVTNSEFDKLQTNTTHLPPGMTLEQSCQLVGCDIEQVYFINPLIPGVYTDFSNASVPH
ncbi:hypothetical protein [Pinirhizobacter soli]|uniref:hypothetical protein n=1 Tax=Pinirhizobacter soli TaxID=2786953 RepID=UPI00202A9583|nr:hypothetical protein [Pinirhizobacter soli]